jgi:histidine triad (HIT) family protein
MSSDELAKAKEAATNAASIRTASTIFDKLLSREIPANIVYEDDKAFCFRDVNPQAPVHILCIPRHKDGLSGLSSARFDHKDILGHLLYVASHVGSKECPNGFRIVINDGVDACQSVFHLHLHILGGRQMTWPPG